MSKSVINKVKGSFHNLGIKLTKTGPFYEFEYEFIPTLLSIEAENYSISFVTPVIDSSDDGLNEHVLNTALDIVEDSHKGCCGDWNDGSPFFVSPRYSIKEPSTLSADWLQEQLKEFYDAYIFLEMNIHLLCDNTIWGLDSDR